MSTFLQLRQLVSRRINQALVSSDIPTIADDTSFWKREEIADWLDEAYQQLYTDIAENEVQTLVTETDGSYTASARSVSLQTLLGISDDPLVIEEVRNVTGDTTSLGSLITYKRHREFRRFASGLEPNLWSRQGIERAWSWFGNSPMLIELYPVPTAAMTLRVRYVPSVPTALGDSTDAGNDASVPVAIPTAHHSLLVEYAVIKAWQKEENKSWIAADKNYREKLERFKASINERQGQESRQTHVVDPTMYSGSGNNTWR